MTRNSLVALTTLVALSLAGQALADRATADSGSPTPSPATDSPSPTASPTASPTPENQAPVAVDDTATVQAGKTVRIDVLANDTDDGLGRPDGTPPRLEVVGVHGGGAGVSYASDHVSYRAASGAAGPVTFGYDVSDGSLVSTATVKVTVQPQRTLSIQVAKTVYALRTYHIHGRVSPTGTRVNRVRVQRLTEGGRWAPYATRPVDGHGRYAARFRPDRLRTMTFRAIADWADGRHTTSARLRRHVNGRPDAQVSGPLTRAQVRYSWRPGCPVPPSELRAIHINRIDYQHRVRRGVIVARAAQAHAIVQVMAAAFDKRFPIHRMTPTEFFYQHGRRTPEQSDVAAMRAGDTSAFNCRPVTGNPYRVSQHSYGNAIDINTIRNPYVTGSRVYPSTSRKWLRRSPYRPGMILSGGVVASTMRRLGWYWGARWSHPDYQHFSSNGG